MIISIQAYRNRLTKQIINNIERPALKDAGRFYLYTNALLVKKDFIEFHELIYLDALHQKIKFV
ncbi:hypothetical protein GCM10011500_43880 [Mucilaginibacter rubeus]|nr:hypothetical protein GCM10011500_43880 [Mucilaginibacter rubeus]